ncbi:arylsulfatase [Lentisphaera profundi]|uniref:Arylsulfatase n=1 Tax=Lentisphaera profundi TaxID=1658616 RepID=A0ABY7VZG5_9BACT|nr:arylsulfatase [Lentisphaera profundi]WDE98171.1 arylsulfatase [Lentisphaera profundi]
MNLFRSAGVFLLALSANLSAAEKPNIIFIYGDDVGYGDVGVYGSEKIPTPNIDNLAKGGIQFTDGHCSAATCSPSRFAMLTGVHAFRHGVSILPPNAPLSIPTDIPTLPKMLRENGYVTGVVGKWHLGIGAKGVETNWNGDVKPGPLEIGFDQMFLLPSTNDRVPCVYLDGHRVYNYDPNDLIYVGRSLESVNKPGSTQYGHAKMNPELMTYYPSTHGHNSSVINGIGRIGFMSGGKKALWDDETMADVFVEKATEFIKEKAKGDKPFFLYFASQDIHVPRAPHPRFQGKTKLGKRGDAMVQFDWSTGALMKALDEAGVADNTIVFFSSDNGPVYDDGYADGSVTKTSTKESDHGHDGSGIYRGGKYQIYEGGTRVPFIIRWPAKIKPAVSNAMVNQVDLYTSLAELVGHDLRQDEAIDSRDTLAAFLGEDSQGLSYMFEEARKTDHAVRKGKWKYISKGNKKKAKQELYDLESDAGEQNNVIKQFPEVAEDMKKLLEQVRKSAGLRFDGSREK